MSPTSRSPWWFAPPIVVAAVFFGSLPWLADADETVTLSITAATAIFVIVWSRFVATRMERALDEVQLAGQRFAEAKGAAGGTIVAIAILLPTPMVDWVTDNLVLMTTGPGDTPAPRAVYAGMLFAVVLLLVMQALGTIVANAVWNRRIGGNA